MAGIDLTTLTTMDQAGATHLPLLTTLFMVKEIWQRAHDIALTQGVSLVHLVKTRDEMDRRGHCRGHHPPWLTMRGREGQERGVEGKQGQTMITQTLLT